ncbi:MAG: hypothetical protein IPM74_10175 [Crocinitomicaceae bacterium]|nr:hypothetical protein [Crocinitomicaceae bacterium]MBK8926258.1 hypothetical protein [Crocinitomicaceae bacterium]
MKKTLIILSLLFGGMTIHQAYAQETVQTEQNPILTGIKPADGQPVTFSSQAELDSTVPGKISALKEEILKNANDSVRVNYLRQQLWRFENAIVVETR